MSPLTLLNPGTWLATGAVIALAYIGLVWWGHTKYQAGVNDTTVKYKAAADAEIAAQEATRKIQFRQAEISQKTYDVMITEVKEYRREKRDPVLADLKRDNDLLRWAVARRGEALAAATDPICVAERRRVGAVEGVLVESQREVEQCTGALVEGEDLVRRAVAKAALGREWAKTVKIGEQ